MLTYGVITAHASGTSDRLAGRADIFLSIGATFLAAASVQARRGHIGIERWRTSCAGRANAAPAHDRRCSVVCILCRFRLEELGALLN